MWKKEQYLAAMVQELALGQQVEGESNCAQDVQVQVPIDPITNAMAVLPLCSFEW